MTVMPEMRTPPKPTSDPFDASSIRTSKEAVKRSRELLEETKAIVERQRHWPAGQGPKKGPPQTS